MSFPITWFCGEIPDLYVELESIDVERRSKRFWVIDRKENESTLNYMMPEYIRSLSVGRGQTFMAGAAEAFSVVRLSFRLENGI